MRRFYAPASSFTKDAVVLSEEETRHLRDVLRLCPGAEVYVIDGEGREFRCRIEMIGKKATNLTIIEAAAPTAPESPLDLTLAVAILKGEKFDLVIQKAVELGVTRLIPIETERGDVKIKDVRKKLDRWERIVLEASKQSGRARLMEIAAPTPLTDVLADGTGTVVVFAEASGDSFPKRLNPSKITVVVGPAGGWAADELDLARLAGATIVTLGGRILRAETAAITAAVIFQHRFGDLN